MYPHCPKKNNNKEGEDRERGGCVDEDDGFGGDGDPNGRADDHIVKREGGGKTPCHHSSAKADPSCGGRNETCETIAPSASSIVLELLEQTAKRIVSESQIEMTSPARHDRGNFTTSDNSGAMSINNNSVDAAGRTSGDHGREAASSTAKSSQQTTKSVVPQLMDIYDDLAQSSTPQTTAPPPQTQPCTPMPRGAHYSGSYETSASRGGRDRKSSGRIQCPPLPAVASLASVRSRPPVRKVKAGEMEDYAKTSRKKSKSASGDQRWSKRFTWPDELHRDFVSAIFDVGLKHSSPSAIMEFMRPNPDVTSERVKSHLQKYRLNRQKSRKEFMASYDCALEGLQNRQQQQGVEQDDIEGSGYSLSSGEAAAHCTHTSLAESNRWSSSGNSSPVSESIPSASHALVLHMPLLTIQEKDGPIGQAFGYLAGMFQALSQQLNSSRQHSDGVNRVPSSQTHAVVAHQNRHESPHPPQQQHHQSLQPTSVEQVAASAASVHHTNDPSIHEVAASIPHAFMMGSQPAVVQPPRQPSFSAGGGHPRQQNNYAQPPQQNHAQPLQQHQHYYHQAQGPSNGQQPSSHYHGVTHTAPAPQGEHFLTQGPAQTPQQMQRVQYAHGAPAPKPAYAHQQNTMSASVTHIASGHHSQRLNYLPSDHKTFSSHEIPTNSHEQQPTQGAATLSPSRSRLPIGAHHCPPALRRSPEPALNNPRLSAPTPQTFMNKVTHEHFPARGRDVASQLAAPPAAAPTDPQELKQLQPQSDSSCDAVANPPVGTGRTLQAQKESNMMKQEMQGQMAFQNKMRALKQIELSKYGGKETQHQPHPSLHDTSVHRYLTQDGDLTKASVATGGSPSGTAHSHGEENSENTNISPLGQQLAEEPDQELIWNPEDDDQIFDFLMEH